MLNAILAGGWIMIPLLVCSVLALAIIIERTKQLAIGKIVPKQLTSIVLADFENRNLSSSRLMEIEHCSDLGRLLVFIVKNNRLDRQVIMTQLEDQGRKVIHTLEKYLNMLGTIATITPLLGLLGTVIGMIDVFTVITEQGVGNANVLAGGISQALVTTAAGLSIAIPCLVFHRGFQRKVDEIAYQLEHESLYFLDSMKTLIRERKRADAGQYIREKAEA